MRCKSVGVLGVAVLLCAGGLHAEDGTGREQPKKWVFAPLVSSSPGFGTGAGGMAMRFYRPGRADSNSPPSTVTAVGQYSDTDSYFTGLFNQSYLYGDSWRLKLGGVHGKVNSELDITDLGEVAFSSTFGALFARSEWRTVGDLFLGFTLVYSATDYEEGNELSEVYFEEYGVEDTENGAFGVVASYDTRDNVMFPHEGTLASAKLTFNPEAFGAVEDYTVLEVDGNVYREIRHRQILALRGYLRTVSEGAPYSALSTLGQRSDLRGYTPGENMAEDLLSAQAEYRWMFARKWGAVGFVGLAALADGGLSDMSSDDVYASGGVGLRYVLHEENRLNFRIDYAWGEADEDGVYVGVREAF